MKKKVLTIPCFLLLLTGCREVKSKTGISMAENAIEAISGQKIDMADVDNIGKNKSEVNVVLDGENISKNFESGFGSITASKETIAITIAGGENGQDNILLGFTGKDLTAERPVKGKTMKGQNSGFSFSMMKVTDSGAETLISFETEGEIVSMNPEKTIIKVKGNLSTTLDAENPEKWKPYEGTIILNYPVFQSLGSVKEDFIY